jgi:hypothetical protein
VSETDLQRAEELLSQAAAEDFAPPSTMLLSEAQLRMLFHIAEQLDTLNQNIAAVGK